VRAPRSIYVVILPVLKFPRQTVKYGLRSDLTRVQGMILRLHVQAFRPAGSELVHTRVSVGQEPCYISPASAVGCVHVCIDWIFAYNRHCEQ
jgi:hypothetical protein